MVVFSFVRWKLGEPRESKIFKPLPKDHPLILNEDWCLVCGKLFRLGDVTQLLALGADTPEGQEKLSKGLWFSAKALVLHAKCMTGLGSNALGGPEVLPA